ncbi:MAG: glycosyltransferase [Acidimicrobiales bacterium]
MSLTYGLLSTYPPTACGLATFTASLVDALQGMAGRDGECRVVQVVEHAGRRPAGVVAELVAGSGSSRRAAARALNDTDVVIVQHEYGIFGGHDGDEVVALLDHLTVPVIVVLHTVLVEPTAHQRTVLQDVVAAADVVVTMTQTARHRLAAGYAVDMARVRVIPHGAHVATAFGGRGTSPPDVARPTILTWGLLGPGKGIEWGIDALALLRDIEPRPRYRIVGKTHPKVLEIQGEAYRRSLQARAEDLGVSADVEFDATYLDVPALQDIVRDATLVLLPYDSPDQITSGVLIEAVAAGKPVVSTRFPHAVELLADGVGLLVDHRDPADIASAIGKVLTDASLRASMISAAEGLAPELAWTAVARGYRAVAEHLVSDRATAVA